MIQFIAAEERIVRTSLDKVTEGVTEKVTEKVTEAEQKLLSLLLEDPAYTYAVLAEKQSLQELNPLNIKVSSDGSDLIRKGIGKSTMGSKGGQRRPRQFKTARQINKLKVIEAAEKLGVSQPTLSAWEGERKSPSIDGLENMADLYGVTTDFLLGRSDM